MYRTALYFVRQSFRVFAICCLLAACKGARTFKEIHTEDVKIVTVYSRQKTVQFVPMHHIGKPEFYVQVRKVVDSLKQQDYIVFYEGVGMDKHLDSLSIDTYQRKLRKMTGFYIDSGYIDLLRENSYFKKFVGQPKYAELGITDTDRNIDISKNRLIDAYEQKFGSIVLEKVDYRMPLQPKNVLPQSARLPRKNVFYVLIDHRNQHLAKNIQSASNSKILVIYGLEHVKGTILELQKMDHSWRSNK